MGCRLVFPSLWILIYLFCGFHSPHHNILFSKRTIIESYNVPVYHTPELDSNHWWHEIGRDPLTHWTNRLWQCCGLQQPWHKPFRGFLPVLDCQQSMSWGQNKVSRVRGKVEIFVLHVPSTMNLPNRFLFANTSIGEKKIYLPMWWFCFGFLLGLQTPGTKPLAALLVMPPSLSPSLCDRCQMLQFGSPKRLALPLIWCADQTHRRCPNMWCAPQAGGVKQTGKEAQKDEAPNRYPWQRGQLV